MKKSLQITLIAVMVVAVAAAGLGFAMTREKAVGVETQPDIVAPQPTVFNERETYAPYDAPESWQTSFTAVHDSLTVNVDAKVITPDVDRYPVYRVGEKKFSDAEMQAMVKTLMQGKEVTNVVQTEDAGIENKTGTASEADLGDVWDGTVNRDDPNVTWPCEYVAVERFDGDVRYLLGYQNYADRLNSELLYQVVDPHMNVFGKVTDWKDGMTGSVTTQAQAIDIGNKLLESMGLTGMKLEYAGAIPYGDPQNHDSSLTFETLPRAHALYYTRYIDGIPVSLVNNHDFNPASGFDRRAGALHEEQLCIKLTDTGVQWFQYETPLVIKEKMAENIELLPFDQVCEQFTKYMQAATHYGMDAGSGVLSRTINIDKISLGFAYVPVPNNGSERYLVPTWEFYGTSLEKHPDSWDDPNYNENNESYDDTLYRSYMSINAYDGSVVDHYAASRIIE